MRRADVRPLKWSEVKRGLDPAKFTIKTMLKRIDRLGDLWQPVLRPGLDLREWLQRLEKVCGSESVSRQIQLTACRSSRVFMMPNTTNMAPRTSCTVIDAQ